MRWAFLDGLVTLQHKLSYPEEKTSRITLSFLYKPHPWTRHPIKTRLHQAKELMKSTQHWLGYFFLGGYRTPLSRNLARFDPSDICYQAWAGAYLIYSQDNDRIVGFEDNEPVIEELASIGIGDQTSWLKSFGDPSPRVKIVRADPLDPKKFHQQAEAAFLGEMWTHSDINPKGAVDWRYHLIFGKPRKDAFELVKPYHDLLLRGYYVAWPIPRYRATIIAYGAAAAWFETRDGRIINYWKHLKHQFRQIIQHIQVRCLPPHIS